MSLGIHHRNSVLGERGPARAREDALEGRVGNVAELEDRARVLRETRERVVAHVPAAPVYHRATSIYHPQPYVYHARSYAYHPRSHVYHARSNVYHASRRNHDSVEGIMIMIMLKES